MMFIDRVTPPEEQGAATAVEVGVWEVSLVRNNNRAGKTLCTYSLDNGPANESPEGILLFRFTKHDWNQSVRACLEVNNIHYSLLRELKINPSQQLLKKKIFVADDDPDILIQLAAILENAGYHVRSSPCAKPVADGNFSWFDLFILDRVMPDHDGLDICRLLRSRSETRDTPVIMISAMPGCSNEALSAGATDCLEKPFAMHDLLNVVARYLKNAHLP